MNIPGDELYTLLHAALKNVGKKRSSARSTLLCGRPYCAEGFGPAVICPARERWRSRSRCPETPLMRRWTSSRSKVICCVAAGYAGGAIHSSDACPDITGPGRQADKTCRATARACAARHSGDGVYAGNACHQLFPLAAVAAVIRSRPARGGERPVRVWRPGR